MTLVHVLPELERVTLYINIFANTVLDYVCNVCNLESYVSCGVESIKRALYLRVLYSYVYAIEYIESIKKLH